MAKGNKKAAKTTTVTSIMIPPEVRQHVVSFNTLMGGVRLGLGVPQSWQMNPQGTAFVPPPEMPKKE